MSTSFAIITTELRCLAEKEEKETVIYVYVCMVDIRLLNFVRFKKIKEEKRQKEAATAA